MSATKITDLYVDYATEITDAPRIYAQWLAYMVLSCVLHKNIWMEYGGFMRVYPNLYLLITGPSSIYRKSYSQKMAASIIKEIYPDFPLMDTSSRESFISEMAREDREPYGSALVMIDEMAGFMARVKSSPHFTGMMQDLSSAFTADTIERRVGVAEKEKKVYRVTEPFLNITAACSDDWLTKSVETSDLTGGFLARFLWIVPPEKRGTHQSEPNKGDPIKRSMLIDRLRGLRDLLGEVKWEPEAKDMWDWWYSHFRTKNQGGKWDANFERMTNQVRKVAMMNAAQRLSLDISPVDLEDAIDITEPLVGHLNDIAIGDTPDEIFRQRILAYLKKKGPVTRTDLLNGIRGLDKKKLDTAIETLKEAERISTEYVENKGRGRPFTKVQLYVPLEEKLKPGQNSPQSGLADIGDAPAK